MRIAAPALAAAVPEAAARALPRRPPDRRRVGDGLAGRAVDGPRRGLVAPDASAPLESPTAGNVMTGDPRSTTSPWSSTARARVLRMRSENDNSTISKEVRIAVRQVPVLVWRWKIVTLPAKADSRHRETDDQAAQLYVTFPRFPERIRSRIIGYVWDTTAPAGTVVQSPSAGAVTYVVVPFWPGRGRPVADRDAECVRRLQADLRRGAARGDQAACHWRSTSNDTHSSRRVMRG